MFALFIQSFMLIFDPHSFELRNRSVEVLGVIFYCWMMPHNACVCVSYALAQYHTIHQKFQQWKHSEFHFHQFVVVVVHLSAISMVVPQKESKWNGIKIARQHASSLPLSLFYSCLIVVFQHSNQIDWSKRNDATCKISMAIFIFMITMMKFAIMFIMLTLYL